MEGITIEVSEDLATRFTEQVEEMAGLEFDPDWELETRFSWCLRYAQAKLRAEGSPGPASHE